MKRREALKAIAVGSTGLVLRTPGADSVTAEVHSHVGQKLALAPASSWRPRFFSDLQTDTVAVIAELIIPETDTPGARAARVHEHMDLVLSEESPAVQKAFLKGLSWIDQKSRERFGADFKEITPDYQTLILTELSSEGTEDEIGRRFFEDIRRRTTFAYYTSEIGIHQELKYKGNAILGSWPGCPHPGHHGDSEP
jgi:hypothetical protein